jgi:hypothetical protein
MGPAPPKPVWRQLLDFRPVVRNRTAMGYVLGYGAHCVELYGIRTWLVAFWASSPRVRAEQRFSARSS